MAAINSGWIPIVTCKRRLTLAFSLLAFLLAGLPHEGNSAIPPIKPSLTPSPTPPTAQECRQHVEKALDQYFEEKPENQIKEKYGIPTPTPSRLPDKTDTVDKSKEKNPPVSVVEKIQSRLEKIETHIPAVETKDKPRGAEKYRIKPIKSDESSDSKNVEKPQDVKETKPKTDSKKSDTKKIETKETHIPAIETKDKPRGAEKYRIKPIKSDESSDSKNVEKPQDVKETKPKNDSKKSDSSAKVDSKIHDQKLPDKNILGYQNLKVDANLAEENVNENEDMDNEDELENLGNILIHGGGNEDRGTANENNIPNKDNASKHVDRAHPNIPKVRPRETVSTKIRPSEDKKDKEKIKDGKADSEGSDTESITSDEEDDEEDETDDEDSPAKRIAKLHPIRYSSSDGKVSYKEKDTGGPDIAATRVVPELPRSQPPLEQPKAKEIPKKTQTVIKHATEGTNQTQRVNATIHKITEHDYNDEGVDDRKKEKDEDLIENIYEDDEDSYSGTSFRSRDHIDVILNLDDIGTSYDQDDDKLALSIFKDIKKIHAASIKPMEVLYQFTDSTSRSLGDAEIFNKPMILFLGPWSTGKTSIINYLLGIERTPAALKTGTGITDLDFTVITHGDKRQTISGTELTLDWRYASLQKFGQGFLDHFKAVTMPHTLLKKINIVDTPGILENRKNLERGYPFNEAFQWFIDRADAIYVVLDPTKVDVGAEMGTIVDQLKGREVRFVLNKADTIRRSDLMKVVGQLFWNLSPLMGSTEAPVIHAVSLSSKPFNPTAPAKFLADQENNFLFDLKDTMDKRVENRILYARRHAVRVRNHAKMVDCYLATYYRHKSIFSNKKNIAKMIVDNPTDYQLYEGLGNLSNVSRYDILDTSAYKKFFQLHPLYDFRPLTSTCSYFRGCPMDKLDAAISTELPELLARYKKAKDTTTPHVKAKDTTTPHVKQEGR